jgi:hypothetical protein
MNASRVQILGTAGATFVTLGLMAAMNSYIAAIQRSAPREVVRLESVTVIGTRVQTQAAATSSPHVGEL